MNDPQLLAKPIQLADTDKAGDTNHHHAGATTASAGPATMTPSWAAATPPAVFYPQTLKRFDDESGWFGLKDRLRPVMTLFEAVGAVNAEDVVRAVNGLDKVADVRLPPAWPYDSELRELLARLAMMQLPDQLTRVLRWYTGLPNIRTFEQSSYGVHFYDDRVRLWESVVTAVQAKTSWTDPSAAAAAVNGMVSLLRGANSELMSLDSAALEADRKRLANASDPTGTGFALETHPNVSIWRYYLRLGGTLRDGFAAAQTPLQSLLELAITALRTGNGTATLELYEKELAVFGTVVPRNVDVRIDFQDLQRVNRAERLVQTDAFPSAPDASRRRVVLESYDTRLSGMEGANERRMAPDDILKTRRREAEALRTIYASANAPAMAALGPPGLRLESDEDWRRFLRAKYREQAKLTSPEDAFDQVVTLVRTYLQAFTTHTPLNIADFGDNQLTLSFPRALTGQLVHDCGVYALRVVYMLSLLREEPDLKLRIRFVRMPVHVGLVITSEKADVGAYFVNNDQLVHYDSTELDSLEKTWVKLDDQGHDRPRPLPITAATHDRFLGELVTGEFIPDVDVPFRLSEAPHLSGNPARDRDTLWRSYLGVDRRDVLGGPSQDPKAAEYQFQLRFLAVLDAQKVHYNTVVVPLWNSALAAWQRDVKPRRNSRDIVVPGRAYVAQNRAALAAALDSYQHLPAQVAKDLNLDQSRTPAVDDPHSQVSSGTRVDALFPDGLWWTKALRAHLNEVEAYVTAIDKGQSTANLPFVFIPTNGRDEVALQRVP